MPPLSNVRLDSKIKQSPAGVTASFPKQDEIWEHIKTQRRYKITAVGTLQCKIPELDMVDCAIYVVDNPTADDALHPQKIWLRPLHDFHDEDEETKGPRFVPVPCETVSPTLLSSPAYYAQNVDDEDWQMTNTDTETEFPLPEKTVVNHAQA